MTTPIPSKKIRVEGDASVAPVGDNRSATDQDGNKAAGTSNARGVTETNEVQRTEEPLTEEPLEDEMTSDEQQRLDDLSFGRQTNTVESGKDIAPNKQGDL